MVNVIVFAPSPDQLGYIGDLLRKLQTDEVRIDAMHHFGSPEILNHLNHYDVIIARGITYQMLSGIPPAEHLV